VHLMPPLTILIISPNCSIFLALLLASFRKFVDYDSARDPTEITRHYKETLFVKNGRMITLHPWPYVPSEDRDYRPTFLLIMSITEAAIYGESDKMAEVVRTECRMY
jgi:hypothetical protein